MDSSVCLLYLYILYTDFCKLKMCAFLISLILVLFAKFWTVLPQPDNHIGLIILVLKRWLMCRGVRDNTLLNVLKVVHCCEVAHTTFSTVNCVIPNSRSVFVDYFSNYMPQWWKNNQLCMKQDYEQFNVNQNVQHLVWNWLFLMVKKESIKSDLSKWKSSVILMNLSETNQFVTKTI